MEKLLFEMNRKLISLFLLIVFFSNANAQNLQDSIQIDTTINGLAFYDYTSTDTSTYYFTLFGDGFYSCNADPKHKYETTSTFETQVFFAKPYKPRKPPRKTISTIINNTTNTFVNPSVPIYDQVDLHTSWSPTNGASNYFILAFKNTKNTSPVDGCVEFHFNSGQLHVDSNNVLIYNDWVDTGYSDSSSKSNLDTKITWDFENLNYNETRIIYIPAISRVSPGNSILLSTDYKESCSSSASNSSSRNSSFLSRRYPHDPNFKIADRECLHPDYEIQKIKYTIGFFNDGDYFATNVFLDDDLSILLDTLSYELKGFEHQPEVYLENRTLNFDFNMMRLPGINQNDSIQYSYEDVSSYVSFTICTKRLLEPVTIYNSAKIIFDTELPIITNTNILTNEWECEEVALCEPIEQIKSELERISPEVLEFTTYPNPVSDILFIKTEDINLGKDDVSIKIINLAGQVMQNTKFEHSHDLIKINLETLETGIYFINLMTDNKTTNYRIIKN